MPLMFTVNKLKKIFSSRVILLRTLSETSYFVLLLGTITVTGLSCAALLSQAIRTAPSQSWKANINALVIGASYVIVVRIISSCYSG